MHKNFCWGGFGWLPMIFVFSPFFLDLSKKQRDSTNNHGGRMGYTMISQWHIRPTIWRFENGGMDPSSLEKYPGGYRFGECITLSQSKSHFCFSKWLLLFHYPLASRYLDDLTYFVRCKNYSSRVHLWPCNPPFWLVWSNSKLRSSDSNFGCKVTVRYGYGSIPINTIFRGMNIHLPAILMWTTGVQGFDTLPY